MCLGIVWNCSLFMMTTQDLFRRISGSHHMVITSKFSFPSCCYHKNLDYRGKLKCEHPQFHEKRENCICSSFRTASRWAMWWYCLLDCRFHSHEWTIFFLLHTPIKQTFFYYTAKKSHSSQLFSKHMLSGKRYSKQNTIRWANYVFKQKSDQTTCKKKLQFKLLIFSSCHNSRKIK